MYVTQNTLVGYTIINGTFGLQLAMLVASVFNYFMFHVDANNIPPLIYNFQDVH